MRQIREHGFLRGRGRAEYELKLHNYYFRDRAHRDVIVWTEVDQVPDCQHDWERLTPWQ